MPFLMLSYSVPQRSPASSIAKTEKQALLVSIKKKKKTTQKMTYLFFYSQISAKHQSGLET